MLPSATEIVGEAVQERFKAQSITTDCDRTGKFVELLGLH